MNLTKRALKKPDPVTGRKVAYLVRVEDLTPHPETGKRRWRTRQVATHDEAKDLQAEWTVEVQRGTALEPTNTVRPENRQPYEIAANRHLNRRLDRWLSKSSPSSTSRSCSLTCRNAVYRRL